jgi:hypothetical protein
MYTLGFVIQSQKYRFCLPWAVCLRLENNLITCAYKCSGIKRGTTRKFQTLGQPSIRRLKARFGEYIGYY